MAKNNGIIKFNSKEDNLDLYIGNVLIGKTPIDVTGVIPGKYSYKIEKSPNSYFSGELYVYPDKTTIIDIDFSKGLKSEKYTDTIHYKDEITEPQYTDEETKDSEEKQINEEPIYEEEEPTVDEEQIEKPIEDDSITQEKPRVSYKDNDNITHHLEDMNKIIEKNNEIMNDVRITLVNINNYLINKDIKYTVGTYDKTSVIETATATKPDDSSDSYQIENINNVIQGNADIIRVYNDGPGLLYVIVSEDGIHYTDETIIYEGEQKSYENVYSIGLRSPTALLRYRLTQREILSQSGQRFTGSRFSDRRDRRGVILYKDDYESPTVKYSSSVTGTGSVNRSTDTSYRGDYSLKLITDSTINSVTSITYSHPDFHEGNVGVQVRFASENDFDIALEIDYIEGTARYRGNAAVTSSTSGENLILSSLIDTTNGFAYFGTDTSPAKIIKVRLSDFTRVGVITLNSGENKVFAAVIDTTNGFAYFGTFTSPAKIVKIRLSDFTRVGSITLNAGENSTRAAIIDIANGFAYFTVQTLPTIIVKINLATFTRVGALTLNSGEDRAPTAIIDTANQLAYFGTRTSPGIVVKVDLTTFTRVGAITLNPGESDLFSSTIDTTNGLAYFGTSTSPAIVVKVDLATFTRVGAITLNAGENNLRPAIIDVGNQLAYFGTDTSPGITVKINLATFTRVSALTLNSGEDRPQSAIIDTANQLAYFPTYTSPAKVIKINLTTFTRVAALTLREDDVIVSSFNVLYPDGVIREVEADVQTTMSLTSWNTFKLVIDIAKKRFISAVINGNMIDLSDIDLRQTTEVTTQPKSLEGIVLLNCSSSISGTCPSTCYVDDYIFTEDESGLEVN